jgi:hypothetical protein
MGDNITIKDSSNAVVPVATEDIGGGVEVQRVKLMLGAHGQDGGDVTDPNPLNPHAFLRLEQSGDSLSKRGEPVVKIRRRGDHARLHQIISPDHLFADQCFAGFARSGRRYRFSRSTAFGLGLQFFDQTWQRPAPDQHRLKHPNRVAVLRGHRQVATQLGGYVPRRSRRRSPRRSWLTLLCWSRVRLRNCMIIATRTVSGSRRRSSIPAVGPARTTRTMRKRSRPSPMY